VSEVVQDGVRVVQIVISQAHRSETSPPQNPIAAPIPLHRRRRPVRGDAIELDDQTGAAPNEVRFIPVNPDAALGFLDPVALQ
jgi:hypothetical protein